MLLLAADAIALWLWVKSNAHRVNVMTSLIRKRDNNRMLPLLLIASIVLLLAIVAAALWSRGAAEITRFATLRLVERAYARVELGRTSQPELAQLGFDPHRLRVRALSGLGVQEYFMPRTSRDFDAMAPAVRACFETPDRCTALVFPLEGRMLEDGGFMAAHAAPRDGGRVVFLLRSGLVSYKAIEGA